MAPRKPSPSSALLGVAAVTEAEGFAVKAVAAGTASETQQRLFFDFVLTRLARVDEPSFAREADGGERVTNFCEGRRSVGIALRALRDLPVEHLRKPNE